MADVKGTNNDDTLNATGLGDVFYGYYGNDLIKGSNGNDKAVNLRTIVENHQPGGDEAHNHGRYLIKAGGKKVLYEPHTAAFACQGESAPIHRSCANIVRYKWKDSIPQSVCQSGRKWVSTA